MSFATYTDAIAKPFMGITPWILRLSFATSFILHGLGKFPMPADGLVRLFESKGIFMPELTASLVALGEEGGEIIGVEGEMGAIMHKCLATNQTGPSIPLVVTGKDILPDQRSEHEDYFDCVDEEIMKSENN